MSLKKSWRQSRVQNSFDRERGEGLVREAYLAVYAFAQAEGMRALHP
jgi:hypothetical protein